MRTLMAADLPAGAARAVWDGRDDSGRRVASGTFFCRLAIGGERHVLRMLLVK